MIALTWGLETLAAWSVQWVLLWLIGDGCDFVVTADACKLVRLMRMTVVNDGCDLTG